MMQRKKLLSLVVALGLVLGLAAPVAADEGADAALSRVTQAVKRTLDLDTDAYDTFRGDRYEDGFTATWSLSWSGSDGSLSIDALDDGTVIYYRLGQEDPLPANGAFPAFPQGDSEAAARAAQSFLGKVLLADEGVELDDPRGMDILGGDSYRFRGEILLNGLPSPLTCSVTVRAADNQVISFSRDVRESTFLGSVPGSRASVSRDKAAETLAGTLALRLEYVLEEDSTAAVLRYLPEAADTYYVDAVTGEAINLTERMADMEGSLAGAGSASDSTTGDSGDNGLSQAEQEGIAKLEGVLSSQTLDSRLRAESAYGLQGYALSSATYQLIDAAEEGEADQVLCTLDYVVSGETEYRSRTVTVDARTGVLQSLYSYAPRLEEGEAPALDEAAARQRAEAFLEGFCGGRWAELALYDSQDGTEDRRPYYTFTYVQEANGIPFPENAYTVAIDCADGSLYRVDYRYEEGITFASPAGIVDEAAALAAWAGTYETVLAYRLVPRPLDGGSAAEARLMELGLKSFYGLYLTYGLEREDSYLGIDAATGQPVRREAASSAIAYTDIAGTWVQADVEKLASFGVGYDGGRFRHSKALTQWDMVALLASLEGYRIAPENAEAWLVDAAYASAYRLGALQRGERDEVRAVTRGEVVQCLLNCAGYGPAARLQGIYTCTYSDAAAIPAKDLGYAAIAQALGMVGGRYDGTRTATRGELAVMLCRLLER